MSLGTDNFHLLGTLGCTCKSYKIVKRFKDYTIECSGFFIVLKGYSDAKWIFDSYETKSASGYVFTLWGGAIIWRSNR